VLSLLFQIYFSANVSCKCRVGAGVMIFLHYIRCDTYALWVSHAWILHPMYLDVKQSDVKITYNEVDGHKIFVDLS